MHNTPEDKAYQIAHMLRTNEADGIDMARGSQFEVSAITDYKTGVFTGFKLTVKKLFTDVSQLEMRGLKRVFAMFYCYLRKTQAHRRTWSFAIFDYEEPEPSEKEHTFYQGSTRGATREGLESYESDTTDWSKPSTKRRASRRSFRRSDDTADDE